MHHSQRLRVVIAGVVATALLVSGCAAPSGGDSTAAAPVAEVNARSSSSTPMSPAAELQPRDSVTSSQSPSIPVGTAVGQLAPEFSVAYADGRPLTAADLRVQEKPYILYFFATW